MKFFVNEEFQHSSHHSLDEGLRTVSKVALIHVNELESMFPMDIIQYVDMGYVNHRFQKGSILDPNFPFIVHKLTEDENYHNRSSRVGPVITRNISPLSPSKPTYRALEKGVRDSIEAKDILVWIFSNWVRDMVMTGKEGCFLDDEGRIPNVRDFMFPFFTSAPRVRLGGIDQHDSRSPETYLDKSYSDYLLYERFGPFASVRKIISNWVDTDRMISLRYAPTGHIQICQGELNTILAYYAYKENSRPTCLAPMF